MIPTNVSPSLPVTVEKGKKEREMKERGEEGKEREREREKGKNKERSRETRERRDDTSYNFMSRN